MRPFVLAMALLLVLAACDPGADVQSDGPSPSAAPTLAGDVVLQIAPGAVPRQRPEDVATIVFRDISSMERMVGRQLRPPRILSMTATGERDAMNSLGQPGNGGAELVWLVHAEGTFATNRGAKPIPPASTGYFIIDDLTGDIVGFGFP